MKLPILPHVPVVGGLKLFWDRITFSRLTKFYFILSVLHCAIQVVFQVQAFVANADAARFLLNLIQQGNATDPGFAVYDGQLRMCDTVPSTLSANSCTPIWDGHTPLNSTTVSDGSTANSTLINGNDYVANVTLAPSTTPALSVVSTDPVTSASSSLSSPLSSAAAPTTIVNSPFTSSSATTSPIVSSASDRVITRTITVTASASTSVTPNVGLKDAGDTDSDGEDEDERDDESDDDDKDEVDVFVSSHTRRRVVEQATIRLTLNGTTQVNLGGLNGIQAIELPRKCLYALNWPVDNVENTKREDIAFIAFQFWLLGMSLVALLNESIPHIVASLLTHIVATAWGTFQIYNTQEFHEKFTSLTTRGACGVNLLPNYWKSRSNAEIPSLALNCFALLVSGFLSWRLMKTFGWQTFKRVGASRTINRVYTLVLMFSIAIQLSLFFVGASAALWLDQVYNGNIGRLTVEPKAFKAIMITVLVLLIPWLTTGWISVRKEHRIPMISFLSVAVLVLVGWATMFIAATFRWTYATWLFFSLMTTLAVVLTLLTLILGIICRINFGKGLTRYLNAQEELGDDGYEDRKVYDSEKIAFPSNDSPIPTFSVTFGSGQEVPPPSQMRFTPRSMGPRFYSQTNGALANPFETPPESNTLRTLVLTRQDSRSSQMSHTSTDSTDSTHSADSSISVGSSKRWVIE